MNGAWLAHHGILGQKWGLRRFQNKDGSYTPAGKKRYYSRTDVENDLDKSINSNKELMGRISTNGPKISEEANRLGQEYEKAFNEFKLDNKTKSEILKRIKDDIGDNADKDDFDLFSDEYINERLIGKVNNKLKSQYDSFRKIQDEYWDDVHTITDDIRKKYEDKNISEFAGYTNPGRMVVSELISKKMDTAWNSYISRHFEDYWIYDTDAYYNAVDRIKEELKEAYYKGA